jgi:hypothetical protein
LDYYRLLFAADAYLTVPYHAYLHFKPPLPFWHLPTLGKLSAVLPFAVDRARTLPTYLRFTHAVPKGED